MLDPVVLEQVDIGDWTGWEDADFGILALADGRFDVFVRGF